MKCDCCNKRKKIFESFSLIPTKEGKLNLCVNCTNLIYKIRDDAKECNREDFEKHLINLKSREKNPSKAYLNWKQEYINSLQNDMNDQQKKEI